jgi:ssDNA-binding Zn-finger/Zn-ribbon topoisomerase 1
VTDEKVPDLSFEKEYQLGMLPTFHITKDGKTTPFHELTDQHLFLAWRWFADHSYRSPVYMALQREKERRKRNLPVPETNPPPAPTLTCPTCGAPMVLRGSKYGLMYGCTKFPVCKTTHGAHPDGKPLGIPASAEVRAARIRAHTEFDKLWMKNEFQKPARPVMKRKEAYAWLRQAMGMTEEEGHIGRFDLEQCERLIALVTAHLKEHHGESKGTSP